MASIKTPKKLIEVALPLDAINSAAQREKSIRHGHPSTLHMWWARRPLAAARAVLFAQMVNDPGYQSGDGFRFGVNKQAAARERERLFGIIQDLVSWENSNNPEVLGRARAEILRSWREMCDLNKNHPDAATLFNRDVPPEFHDPFSGGGAIPLEAQRLGLVSTASDLNPVAVSISKAMIEIPPRFWGIKPVGPIEVSDRQATLTEDWAGSRGLAEDVRRYGLWIRDQAAKRLRQVYPKVAVTKEMAAKRPDLLPLVGQQLTVIAWLWARTVRSPNPIFSHIPVPLVTSFVLSKKPGKEAYIQPIVDGDSYRFEIRLGIPPEDLHLGTKLARGANFKCLLSDAPLEPKYIKNEGVNGRLGARMLAIVAEGVRGRIYLDPLPEHEELALSVDPGWRPETPIPDDKRSMFTPLYGLTKFADLFTSRQLFALNCYCDLILEAKEKALTAALEAGMANDGLGLDEGGAGAKAYSDAIALYLAFTLDRLLQQFSTLSVWSNNPAHELVVNGFGRQAIPMTWDYGEVNPLCEAASWEKVLFFLGKAVDFLCDSTVRVAPGKSLQADAQRQEISSGKVVSTDPPYYDNIGYADLSDFFYVWLRRALKPILPDLFATLAVPKADELVANPYRHGGKDKAEHFFLSGMTSTMGNIARLSHPAYPVTIYYAFKQSDTVDDEGTHSTGWETFLQAVISAGFAITGTWPMRTEKPGRMMAQNSNALASSIILVCRRRSDDAETVSRREFIRELNAALPEALDEMTRGGVNSPVAPVDLSQAIIGPGMAIFSQYAAVLEADGTPMRVKTALQLINRFLAEEDFDSDTQFCLHWFEQQGWATGKFGEADVLARAKGTSVSGLQATGVVASSKGDLRLLRWAELPRDWSPEADPRLPVWEALHHLIRAFNQDGESAAGVLLARMPGRAEPIRALAYRLYTLCERKGWSDDARFYNELVSAWSAVEQAASEAGVIGSQAQLDI